MQVNAVRLQLLVLGYNRANLLRTLALSQEVGHGSLTSIRENLVMKLVTHGSCATFQMPEVAVLRDLLRLFLANIVDLR